MEERYDPAAIESKWQKKWDEWNLFKVTENPELPKYYLLEMFPYPSGKIHMGHVRNYTIGDVVARYKRMQGFNVLHPMGWDAFGMPAENAAIANNTHPAKWTYANIDSMRFQLKRLGFSYDWERELATCQPEYYRWEQWLFIKMYEKGMAYRKESYVNWCEDCQTVLANEQVEAGLCWRCGQQVRQKQLWQWFFKITDFAQDLLMYCDKLPGWPEKVITMQKNWIGKSIGAQIDFAVENLDEVISVFTTRQDTVFGATFMCLAPEHPLVFKLSRDTAQEEEVRQFVERIALQDRSARSIENYEKEGVFTGAYCLNPMTGKRMPVYTANFALMEYGTGAVMSVPAHYQRDLDFAKKYGLEIIVVVRPEDMDLDEKTMTEAFTGKGVMINSGKFDNMDSQEALVKIADYLQINYVIGSGELAIFCGALAGSGLGFLWFNAYPAQIFMGDVGSLSLGASLGTIAVITKQEILLVLVGGLFVMEALSVIFQVGFFKMTHGKRIFRMAPLHHHFELKGWPEPKVIVRFWIIAIALALLAMSTLKLR